jgi:hypothetical protein
MRFTAAFLCLFLLIGNICAAQTSTWDEPWHEQVVKGADTFILAKIKAVDARKGLTVDVLRPLGGSTIKGTLRITDFYALSICGTLGSSPPGFRFRTSDTCYFFLKKTAPDTYSMATPTTGFAVVFSGGVRATYRHSYHQAMVPQDVYEPTMGAIFRHYHGLPYDTAYVRGFVSRTLALPPAASNTEGRDTFFRQHVALESIYHLSLPGYYEVVLPFLHDTTTFHTPVSAARALTASNTRAAHQQLLALVRNPQALAFTRLIAVRSLAAGHPSELKRDLKKLVRSTSDEKITFGGNLLDPRICTRLPSLKAALTQLVKEL